MTSKTGIADAEHLYLLENHYVDGTVVSGRYGTILSLDQAIDKAQERLEAFSHIEFIVVTSNSDPIRERVDREIMTPRKTETISLPFSGLVQKFLVLQEAFTTMPPPQLYALADPLHTIEEILMIYAKERGIIITFPWPAWENETWGKEMGMEVDE